MGCGLLAAVLLLGALSVEGKPVDCSRVSGCSQCRLQRNPGKPTDTLCSACQTGWTLRPDGKFKTCDCAPGWAFNQNKICALCDPGQYCPGGSKSNPDNKAFICPPGTASMLQGAISVNQCFTRPGYGRVATPGPNGKLDISALLCEVGTYNGGSNTLPCQGCGPGLTTASKGSTSQAQCLAPPGHFIDKSTFTAQKCQKGTYSSTYSANTICTSCPADATTLEEGSGSAAACIPAN